MKKDDGFSLSSVPVCNFSIICFDFILHLTIASERTLPRTVRISIPKSLAMVGAMSINLAYSKVKPGFIPLPQSIRTALISALEGSPPDTALVPEAVKTGERIRADME
ncbi:MAG: hypothetical protein IPJ07_21235 [Acidobacteria bacterium]|nr:hypothetical protein [Acidobacteriota bacterium]